MTAEDRTTDTPAGALPADHTGIPHYEIRVRGHLGSRWAAWFDGFNLTSEDGGTTVIHAELVDQPPALHGVLQKVRDIGIPLISIALLPSDAPTAHSSPPTNEGN